jgi:dTDP-4-dehydrorhamnose reductase
MRLIVTGGSSFLGSHILKRAARTSDWNIAATYFAHPIGMPHVAAYYVDMRDEAAVRGVISATQPDVIIHTPAVMSGELLDTLNINGSGYIAKIAKEIGARLIHVSSDVIFDGEHAPYGEHAQIIPLTPYAKSKAAAERVVREYLPDPVIVRTSLIYELDPPDPRTSDILDGKMPHLFSDEYRCPIFADDLADALIELAKSSFTGPLHIAGPQKLSRHEFGLKLACAFQVEPRFEPALSSSYPIPRPRDCALDISLAQNILQTKLNSVDDIIREFQRMNE